MFQKYFNDKKQCNKKYKTKQNFVVSFIKNTMNTDVFAVGKNHHDHKRQQKQTCKNPLALTKHTFFFLKFSNYFLGDSTNSSKSTLTFEVNNP